AQSATARGGGFAADKSKSEPEVLLAACLITNPVHTHRHPPQAREGQERRWCHICQGGPRDRSLPITRRGGASGCLCIRNEATSRPDAPHSGEMTDREGRGRNDLP